MSKTNVKLISHHLVHELIRYISEADTIYLLVSFIMDSGVQLLAPHLQNAADRGAEVKILTGDYLYVTQPQALSNICRADNRIEVRLWKSDGIAFHPKAYLFQTNDDQNVVFVGSSNLSRSALTNGVEWNISIASNTTDEAFQQAEDLFMKMFYDARTISLNETSIEQYTADYELYHQSNPNLVTQLTTDEEIGVMFDDDYTQTELLPKEREVYQYKIEPRRVQIETLEQLQQTREEGYDKGLVVMTTGLGKTFLAAMFAANFRRVLFIAHREEILFQAKRSFETV